MHRTVGLLIVTALAPVALAAPQDAPAGPADPAPAQPAEAEDTQRKTVFEVGFRGRSLSVPGGIVDIWYEDADHVNWPLEGERRPRIRGYAAGLELLLKRDTSNTVFYAEYIKSTMDEGYWDDRDGNDNPLNGEYLKPTDNLGLVAIGANYLYEAKLVDSGTTNGVFGWSLLVGGGLGVALRTGGVDRWVQGDDGAPAYRRYDEGQLSDGRLENAPPLMLPMVDITGGMRFTFGDRLSLRVEGGLHTMVYYGASAGLIF